MNDQSIQTSHQPGDEISLLDIGVTLARKRRLVVRSVVLFGILGLVMALAAPPEYRSSMTVMSELGAEGGSTGGLGATLRSFGFAVPGAGAAGSLSAQAIPDIAASREVRLAVVRDSSAVAGVSRGGTLSEYLDGRGGSRIGSMVRSLTSLPGRVVGMFRRPASGDAGASPFLTESEDQAVRWLDDVVSITEDMDSGLITISATTDDPVLATGVVASVAQNLRKRVQEVYTERTRQNLEFVDARFQEARDDLRSADNALAVFADRNQSMSSARLQLEGERLQREVTFKTQLYTELQAQVTQARIELQQSQPVITTIEAPAPPMRPSGPNRKLMLLLALVLGAMVGMALAFLSAALERGRDDAEDRHKLDQIGAAFPAPLRRWFRARPA